MGLQIELSYFFYKQFHAKKWIEARYAFPQYTVALQKNKKQPTSIEMKFFKELPGTACWTTKGMNKPLKSLK